MRDPSALSTWRAARDKVRTKLAHHLWRGRSSRARVEFASRFAHRRARSASSETLAMASGSAALGAILEKVGSSDKGAW